MMATNTSVSGPYRSALIGLAGAYDIQQVAGALLEGRKPNPKVIAEWEEMFANGGALQLWEGSARLPSLVGRARATVLSLQSEDTSSAETACRGRLRGALQETQKAYDAFTLKLKSASEEAASQTTPYMVARRDSSHEEPTEKFRDFEGKWKERVVDLAKKILEMGKAKATLDLDRELMVGGSVTKEGAIERRKAIQTAAANAPKAVEVEGEFDRAFIVAVQDYRIKEASLVKLFKEKSEALDQAVRAFNYAVSPWWYEKVAAAVVEGASAVASGASAVLEWVPSLSSGAPAAAASIAGEAPSGGGGGGGGGGGSGK